MIGDRSAAQAASLVVSPSSASDSTSPMVVTGWKCICSRTSAGLREVILPERNRGDLDDVPADVREQMQFHPVTTIGEVLSLALEGETTKLAA